ncbi:MAG: hypothetical protein AAF267_06975 [Deinococcota bacterium]
MKYWFIFVATGLLALLAGCSNFAGGSHAEAEHEGMSASRSLVEILDTPAPKTQDLRLVNIRPGGSVTDSRIPREPGDALVIDIKPPIPTPEDLDYAPEPIVRRVGDHGYGAGEHGDSDHAEAEHMEDAHAEEASEHAEGVDMVDALPAGEGSLRAQVQELTAKAQELTERLEQLSNQ